MKSGLNKGLEEMNPWPKLVFRTSMLGAISSTIAIYAGLLSGASPSVLCSFLAAAYVALVPACVSGKFYIEQKLDKGLLSCSNTEKEKFYGRVFVTSTGIAISSVVAGIALLPNYSVDAHCSAMICSLLAEGVMGISYELRDAANIKPLRREVDSLDENREREGSYFVNKLRNFDLIGNFKKNREDSLRLNLLQGFVKDEDELSASSSDSSARERIFLSSSSNSGSRYGSSGHTTTSGLL